MGPSVRRVVHRRRMPTLSTLEAQLLLSHCFQGKHDGTPKHQFGGNGKYSVAPPTARTDLGLDRHQRERTVCSTPDADLVRGCDLRECKCVRVTLASRICAMGLFSASSRVNRCGGACHTNKPKGCPECLARAARVREWRVPLQVRATV